MRAQVAGGGGGGVGEAEEAVTVASLSRRLAGNVEEEAQLIAGEGMPVWPRGIQKKEHYNIM